MQPNRSEQQVIDAAEELAAALDDGFRHTVAAAAMDTFGRIHTGVNVYHFTGGPCAEVVAIGAAATAGAGPLITMAAAGDQGRNVLSPCGRCRQTMLDLHPDVMVAVPDDQGPQMVPVRALLPGAYEMHDAARRQVLRFAHRYYDAVRDGAKTATVRWNDPIPTGRVVMVFEDHPDGAVLHGDVTAVSRCRLADLTAESAGVGADTDMSAYRHGLRQHYPDMPDDAEVDVVRFTVDP